MNSQGSGKLERCLRVLIVTEHYWPERFRITGLAQDLKQRGLSIEVLTGMPNYPSGKLFPGYRLLGPLEEEREGVRITRVPVVPRGSGKKVRLALNYLSFAILASLKIAFTVRRWDVVLVFQPSPVTTLIPGVVASSARVPLLVWIQDIWPHTLRATGIMRSTIGLGCIEVLSRALYRRCDRILGQSLAYLRPLQDMGIGRDRFAFLPNWAEDLYGDTSRSSVSTNYGDGPSITIMFAGNLGRVQALDTILEAMVLARNRVDCRWVFVGDGVMRDWLEREVRRRGLDEVAQIVGPRPIEEMPQFFSRASALLVSLKPDPDISLTMPSKLQSYLAAGVPVIGSIDGEAARVIQEAGAGLLAPAGDSKGLADAVVRLASLSPEELAEMGKRGKAYYRKHFARNLCLARVQEELTCAVEAAGEAI